MREGKIAHEHVVGTALKEDLAAFRRSGLGKAIAAGDPDAMAQFGLDGPAATQWQPAAGD